MVSSSGFGSTPYDSIALFELAFAAPPLLGYAKGTQSPRRAPTVCMYAVSGSISLPSRGSFRLSFTVLVRYRSIMSI